MLEAVAGFTIGVLVCFAFDCIRQVREFDRQQRERDDYFRQRARYFADDEQPE